MHGGHASACQACPLARHGAANLHAVFGVRDLGRVNRGLTPTATAQLPCVPARTCSTLGSNWTVKPISLKPAFAPTLTTSSFISPTSTFCGAVTAIGTAKPVAADGSADNGTGEAAVGVRRRGLHPRGRAKRASRPTEGAALRSRCRWPQRPPRRRPTSRSKAPALRPARHRSSPSRDVESRPGHPSLLVKRKGRPPEGARAWSSLPGSSLEPERRAALDDLRRESSRRRLPAPE